MTFWEHLDVLRSSIIRMLVAAVAMAVVAFCLKDWLFGWVLAPSQADFFLYRWLNIDAQTLRLVNTELTEQFMIHLRVALMVGVLVASPYILYLLYRFISPGLYERERRVGVRLVAAAYAMFIVGVAVCYMVVFPVSVQFLGNYSVSQDVENLLTITSYVDTLLMLCLVFGIVFELPVLAWLLARFGLLRAEWMSRYRLHAIVAILIVAAIITPTADALTLVIVALPIWLLYEVSVLVDADGLYRAGPWNDLVFVPGAFYMLMSMLIVRRINTRLVL
ncbi:MAG: twin-arginine translocase subunit TatC, partial [Bacteroidaceae bacterium]|nr:twin-arginine translocase subunit TatC [Bacteroidaceae bacterium]